MRGTVQDERAHQLATETAFEGGGARLEAEARMLRDPGPRCGRCGESGVNMLRSNGRYWCFVCLDELSPGVDDLLD